MGNVIKELDALGYESGSGTNADSKINNGYDTEYTYNLANKVIKVLDPVTKQKNLNFTKQYAYDALGRIVSETDAKGTMTLYTYDDAGNVTCKKVKKSSGPEQVIESNTYDFIGNLLSVTDGNGNTTTFEYNTFGELRSETHPRFMNRFFR